MGADAYARSDAWWRGMSTEGRTDWKAASDQLSQDWMELASSGVAPDSAEAQALAARHVDWLRGIPGTPAADPSGDLDGYVRGLAEMYVADERFAANYGGRGGRLRAGRLARLRRRLTRQIPPTPGLANQAGRR